MHNIQHCVFSKDICRMNWSYIKLWLIKDTLRGIAWAASSTCSGLRYQSSVRGTLSLFPKSTNQTLAWVELKTVVGSNLLKLWNLFFRRMYFNKLSYKWELTPRLSPDSPRYTITYTVDKQKDSLEVEKICSVVFTTPLSYALKGLETLINRDEILRQSGHTVCGISILRQEMMHLVILIV